MPSCLPQNVHISSLSRPNNISGTNAQGGRKVCLSPTHLDVFSVSHLDITSFMRLACGQSWSVLDIRRLLMS